MAFQQTTATNQDDVCAQIAAFAVANAGFTNNGTIVVSTKNIQRLSKGGTYFYFGNNNAGNGGATASLVRYRMAYNLAATMPTSTTSQEFDAYWGFYTFPGPYTNLFLFTEGTVVHCAVELTNGIWTHMSFGHMTKTDATIDGGAFMTASIYAYISGSIWQAPTSYQNGNVPMWLYWANGNLNRPSFPSGYMLHRRAVPFNDYRDFAEMGVVRNGIGCFPNAAINSAYNDLVNRTPNVGTNRSIMFTNYVALHDSVSGLQKLAGYIPGMRVLNMRNIDEKEIIYTDWQVFPFSQRNGNNVNAVNTSDWAYAYKRA